MTRAVPVITVEATSASPGTVGNIDIPNAAKRFNKGRLALSG